jgi:RNA polymerase sigma factor (TIGR02999 family)
MQTGPGSSAAQLIARRIAEASAGEQAAGADLTRLLYAELRKLAGAMLGRAPGPVSLHPTSLVHEAFLKLVGPRDPGWDGRAHFFGAAARAMRELVVDEVRRRGAAKRGGDRVRVSLVTSESGGEWVDEEILALHSALRKLEAEDTRKGQIVMLRYFAGFTAPETADVLGVSLSTVEREWRFARAWLRTEMSGG